MVLPSATITYEYGGNASDPFIASVMIIPPATSNYLTEVASPVVTTSTPRVTGLVPVFYFARNISSTTGNYLSTYAAFVPSPNFAVTSDQLYEPPAVPPLEFVQIFADSKACSPVEVQAACSDYVKIRNTSDQEVDVSMYRVRTGVYGQASTSTNTAIMSGVILPTGTLSVPINLNAAGSWVWLEDIYGVELYTDTLMAYPSSSGHDNEAWSYDPLSADWRWTKYLTPFESDNNFGQIVKPNECQGLALSEIGANLDDDDQFIEIYNATNLPIDLTGCILQTNRSVTKQYVLNGIIEPDTFSIVYIRDTELLLTKTTNGVVYLLSSDGENEMIQVSYDGLATSTSWSLIEGIWQQTYAPTPGSSNQAMEFAACSVGYERNLATGMCNKISNNVAELASCGDGKYRSEETNRCRQKDDSTTLSSCEEGQYRNPDTNRCRSLATVAGFLAPCAPGQERNPDTNRCRAAQTSAQLTPCESGQERNPETNRCRNKTAAIAADFPVEAVEQSAQATLGWWAFGAVGILAVGYGGWEWRREVVSIVRKIGSFGIGRR
ncbi:MAG: hypothetical protein WBK76_04580 [Candidatus Saccharimonadales bacterium]